VCLLPAALAAQVQPRADQQTGRALWPTQSIYSNGRLSGIPQRREAAGVGVAPKTPNANEASPAQSLAKLASVAPTLPAGAQLALEGRERQSFGLDLPGDACQQTREAVMERRQPLSGLLRLCGCPFLASSLRLDALGL
jgi:hypothetical protein